MPRTATKKNVKKKATKAKKAAKTRDRHVLYEQAVQCVEAEIDFVDATYKALRGRYASSMREDFCGTANTSCEWVRRRPSNTAVGLDIDTETLEWGTQNNLSKLTDSQRDRVRLIDADVLNPPVTDGYDVVLAMNFSYWCFKQRHTMLTYFRKVRESLGPNGLLFLDFYGGPDALREMKERKDVDGKFTYIWDQASYNPITGDLVCHIHFKFPDGSRMRRAFTYEWRLWTIPEIRDILAEAGFKKSTVYWEGDDEDTDGGNGEFLPTEQGEACPAFVAYLSAEP